MGYIKILDESVSNIIAAGEVVENPASMIKEMIENSLDAKATVIKIEVFKGGTEVKINDNGIGMDKEDTLLSIERHATSKISFWLEYCRTGLSLLSLFPDFLKLLQIFLQLLRSFLSCILYCLMPYVL